jgi:hypothetical protein
MASSQDKVISFHISRLKDKRSDVLLKTIEQLVTFGADAQDALPLLEDLFKTSEDIDVRKAAQDAGRSIYLQVQEQKKVGEAQSS